MNKRLLLALYDRSGLGAYMPVDYKGHELAVEEHIEKFAQLIVRECMEVAGDSYTSTPEDCVYYVDLAVNRIAEHFGVEE
jgi:hypothetical protein